jgi:hypothetical protein
VISKSIVRQIGLLRDSYDITSVRARPYLRGARPKLVNFTPFFRGLEMKTAQIGNVHATVNAFSLDLSDLAVEELNVLMQVGSKGMPDFAASCGSGKTSCCARTACSCGSPSLVDSSIE